MEAIQSADATKLTRTPKTSSKPHITSSLFTFNPARIHVPVAMKENYNVSNGISENSINIDASTCISSLLSTHLKSKMGIESLTAIQQIAVPVLKDNQERDVIIHAQTGSGKTLSYLLPIVDKLISKYSDGNIGIGSRSNGTLALIICPTRELVTQVESTASLLLSVNYPKRWIVVGTLSGGEKKKSEKARLRKGVTLLITTPGRLLDHLKTTESFDYKLLEWLVFDEADRFAELGFKESVKEILDLITSRVTKIGDQRFRMVLCSATMTNQVTELGGCTLRDPIYVQSVKETDKLDVESLVPNQLHQYWLQVPAKLRLVTLSALILKITKSKPSLPAKIIIFFSNCDSVDFFFDLFTNSFKSKDSISAPFSSKIDGELNQNVNVFKLHGNILHNDRIRTFKSFSKSQAIENSINSSILFCTDVAARGLDFPDATHIIQYDPPSDTRDYVHRVGRTCRLGRQGSSYLFLLPSEIDYVKILASEHEKCDANSEERKGKWTGSEISVESVLQSLKYRTASISKDTSTLKTQNFRENATSLQQFLESYVLSTPQMTQMAHKSFGSFIRSYATHIASQKSIFHVKKLHLGHVAKSFGLREAPAKFRSDDKKAASKNPRGSGRKREKNSTGVSSYVSMLKKRTANDEFNIEYCDKKSRTK